MGLYRDLHAKFLSTLSLRRATIRTFWMGCRCRPISIHALLAESDNIAANLYATQGYFYPRSPCGERPKLYGCTVDELLFLSTLSLRRATYSQWNTGRTHPNFYPRSPCGERRIGQQAVRSVSTDFYPRSPCGERRDSTSSTSSTSGGFLSTLSLRRATNPVARFV